MGLVEHLDPNLALVDYTQTSVKLKLTVGSFIFFCSVYGCSTLVSAIFKTYHDLKIKEKIFWNLAVVRGVYGIFCIVTGSWAIFVDTELEKDVVYATTPTSYFAMTITVGFFGFECLMILWSDIYFQQSNLLLNIHHWLSLIGFSILIYLDCTHYFGTRALILEMSTPFSCLCWTLLKANKSHTMLWKVNQFLLVHTFHLRSVVECSIWYVTYTNWNTIWSTMPTAMFVILYVQLFLVTFIMTPYWTYKKTAQMINPVDWNFEDTSKVRTTDSSWKQE